MEPIEFTCFWAKLCDFETSAFFSTLGVLTKVGDSFYFKSRAECINACCFV